MSIALDSRQGATSEMNVTPLIDVLLVLLIIFMVLPQQWGERADIPQPAPDQPVTEPGPVVIQLRDSGDGKAPVLEINHHAVVWTALEDRLQDIFKTRSDRTAFLKGDPEIDFQYVAEIVDKAHHAGVDRVGLMRMAEND